MLNQKSKKLFTFMGYKNPEHEFYSEWWKMNARHEIYCLLETVEAVLKTPKEFMAEQVKFCRAFMTADVDIQKEICDYYLKNAEESNGQIDHMMSLLCNAGDEAGIANDKKGRR